MDIIKSSLPVTWPPPGKILSLVGSLEKGAKLEVEPGNKLARPRAVASTALYKRTFGCNDNLFITICSYGKSVSI